MSNTTRQDLITFVREVETRMGYAPLKGLSRMRKADLLIVVSDLMMAVEVDAHEENLRVGVTMTCCDTTFSEVKDTIGHVCAMDSARSYRRRTGLTIPGDIVWPTEQDNIDFGRTLMHDVAVFASPFSRLWNVWVAGALVGCVLLTDSGYAALRSEEDGDIEVGMADDVDSAALLVKVSL